MADAPIFSTIYCHAWNATRTMIALSPANNEIHIFKVANPTDSSTWELLHTLKEHDQPVTALDWAPKTDRILSCSQDRNAYVWTFSAETNEWKPTLVLLRINRAATCCKWSPEENKFAVGSSSKCVCICYFEQENDWWVSKIIRKHKSTVLSVAWHPANNTILATASSDFKCRIWSTTVKDIDKTKGAKFGQLLNEFGARTWVHDVAWSPSGNTLAFLSHDSSIHFVEKPLEGQAAVQTSISYNNLPFRCMLFLSESALIGAGHDFVPFLFTGNGANWSNQGSIDKKEAVGGPKAGAFSSAKSKFDNMVTIGSAADDRMLPSKHQNTISGLRILATNPNGSAKSFSSSGLDGRIVVWDTASLKL